MKTPKISVIMPVYNGEKYLRQAINSILSQTFTDYELIIINDGSTDASEQIILSYEDARIRYIKNERNLKLIKTLNRGVALAKGIYISRMDADDIAVKTLFEQQIKTFEKDTTIDIVNISTYELSSDGKRYRPFPQILNFDTEALKYVELFENQITHPGIMVKSELMKAYGYKDDGTVVNFEDVDLWIRMLWDGRKCVTLKDRLLFYRINENSVTRKVGNKRNIKRVQYNNKLIFNLFNISLNENSLYYLYGDTQKDYCAPFEVNKTISKISKHIPFGSEAYNQFYKWFHLRMTIVSLQIIKTASFSFKCKAFWYMLLHVNKLLNSTFFQYLRFKLKNKWLVYEDCNIR